MEKYIIKFDDKKNRSIALDGNTTIGECNVKEENGSWCIVRTVVDKKYGGQGIAGELVRCVAINAQEKNIKLIPKCSYAEHYFKKHPEFKNIVITDKEA